MNLRDHQRDTLEKRPYSDRDQMERENAAGDRATPVAGYGDYDEHPADAAELASGEERDARLREDVSDALAREGGFDTTLIEVSVEEGEVTLAGFVSDPAATRAAEEVAARCPGVQRVRNQLRSER